MEINKFINEANIFISNYTHIHEYNIGILNSICQKEYQSPYYKLVWKNNKIHIQVENSPEGMLWELQND